MLIRGKFAGNRQPFLCLPPLTFRENPRMLNLILLRFFEPENMSTFETSASLQPVPAAPRPRRQRMKWLALFVLATTATGVYGGYRVWINMRIDAYAMSCREAMHKKDWPRVSELASAWSKLAPQQADPWICLAAAAGDRGEFPQAVEFLGHLPDGDPKTPMALLERSGMHFNVLNRPIEGAADCDRALRLQPHLAEAHQRLIFFYAFTMQRARMAKQIRAALQNDCDLPETYIYLLGRDWMSFANATQENVKWLRSDPDNELYLVAAAMFAVGALALDELSEPEKENLPRANSPLHQRYLAELFERFPHNMELLVYYLKQASNDGDDDRVTALLALAPPEAVDDNRFWRFKGWLHAVRNELDEAESAYRKALEIHPYDYVAQHQLAAVARRLQKFDEVEALEARARTGNALRREILPLPDVRKGPKELQIRIATYAASCGDDLAARKLLNRSENLP